MAVLAALELRALTRRYGERLALADLSFTLEAGQTLAVLGPNGAGKTTLLSILAGVVAPDEGELTLAGRAADARCSRLRGLGGARARTACARLWWS